MSITDVEATWVRHRRNFIFQHTIQELYASEIKIKVIFLIL